MATIDTVESSLSHVSILDLQHGDKIVVNTPESCYWKAETRRKFRERLEAWSGVPVFILPAGAELSVLRGGKPSIAVLQDAADEQMAS